MRETRRETRIVTAESSVEEIDRWIATAFEGVTRDDLRVNNKDSLGSDDVPRLTLVQEETDERFRRVYGGEWGCHRTVRWADHDNDPPGSVYVDGHGVISAGQYAVEFARQNRMRVQLILRWPWYVDAPAAVLSP